MKLGEGVFTSQIVLRSYVTNDGNVIGEFRWTTRRVQTS